MTFLILRAVIVIFKIWINYLQQVGFQRQTTAFKIIYISSGQKVNSVNKNKVQFFFFCHEELNSRYCCNHCLTVVPSGLHQVNELPIRGNPQGSLNWTPIRVLKVSISSLPNCGVLFSEKLPTENFTKHLCSVIHRTF